MAIRYLSGINVDSNTLFVDDANNRVGIGTGAPTAKLQLYGSGLVEANVTSTNDQALLYLQGTFGQVANNAGDFYITNSAPSSSLILRTADTERMRVTAAGNVGIGTTTPNFKLQVNGDFAAEDNIYLTDAGTVRGKFELNSSDRDDVDIKAVSLGSNMKFFTVDTERMRITSDGNVGIGTTSPSEKLHVVGSTVTVGTSYLFSNTNASYYNSGGNALFHQFESYWDTNSASSIATYRFDVGTWRLWSLGTGSAVVTVKSNGNVGIGTTSPGYSLDVAGTSRSDLHIFRSNQSAPTADAFIFRPADNTVALGTANSERIRVGSSEVWFKIGSSTTGYEAAFTNDDNGFNIYASRYGGTGKYLTLNSTGAVENMRLTSNGNVGIGTTSPNARLTVVANDSSNPNVALRLSSTGYSGVSYPYTSIRFGSAYSSYPSWNLASIDAGYTGASWGGSLLFYTNNDSGETNLTERMRITAAGNVGIGTTSPSTKLHTVGNIRSANAGNTVYSELQNDGVYAVGTDLYLLAPASKFVSIYAGNAERMRIASTGATRLNAYGSGSFTGTVAYNLAVDSSGNIIETAGGVVDGSGTANYVSKWSDANTLTDSQLFDNGTNVGIGTSSPANTLQIGSVGATGYSGNRLAVGDGTNVVALHPGAVSYLTANGDIVIGAGGNTTNQVYVKSGGNVGIGTTSPAGKLHIADDGPNALIIGDTQVSTIGETNNGGYPGMKIVPYNSNIHIGISSTTDNKINLWYGGQNYTYWQQLETYSVISNYSTSALVLQVNGGNVGIGTTSPSFRFDVAGAAGDWATRFTSNAGASAYFAHGGGYGGYIDAGSNASASTYLLSLVSNGSTRVYIKGNGDVGIGTTSSINNSLLSVGGGINTTTGIIGYNTADWFTLNGKTQPHYGFNLIPTSSSPIGISGYFGISLATEGSERIRILGNGNVGIGTTSPATKLHVVGYSRNDGGLLLNGSDADYREIIFTTSAASRWNLYAYGGESGSNAGSVLYLARYADNGDYIANVATFLRTNGYVGIATSTPTQQLHVSGNIRVTGAYYDSNNSAGSSGQVLSSTGSGTDWVSLSEITGVDGTGTANYVTKWQDANTVTDSVIYDNGTNVGIGTLPNQGVRLQVAGAVDAWSSLNTLLRLSHDGTRGKIQSYTGGGYSPTAINADGGNVLIGTDTDAGHLLYVNGTSRFNGVIHGSTRLMVGITSDQTYASIFVGGDITTGGSQYALLLDPQLSGTNNYGLLANARIKASHAATNAYGVYIVNNETLSGASIVNNYGLYIADQTRGSSVNYALYSAGGTSYFAGNVGIGTGSPSTKLEVGNFLDAVTNKITVAARYEYEPEFNFRLGQSGTNLDWIGSVISSGDDGNYNGKILFKTANAGRDTPTTKMVIKANGNVLIGTTTDGGYKLRVNGTGRYDDYLQLWSGTAGASPRLIFGGETSSTDKSIFLESYYMVFQGHNNEGFKFQTTSSLGAVTNRMSILGTGTVVLSNYGSGSKTGTVAYNLAVDASGNVIETAGGVVDGSGTANYVTKWQDANTVTDSQIRDDGTTVGVGTAPAAAKLTVDGALTAAGQTSYGKSYASLDTTGVAVAGLSSSSNGQSALFTFTCYGGDNHYQRVVYSCKNDSGTWYTSKVVDEGTNGLDVTASANGATITFTYKARSANQGYSPRILIDHLGSAINTSYL